MDNEKETKTIRRADRYADLEWYLQVQDELARRRELELASEELAEKGIIVNYLGR